VRHYQAYILRHDTHFMAAVDLDCADDEVAIKHAKRLLHGNDVELWHGTRRVVRLFHRLDHGRRRQVKGKKRASARAPFAS
jgi:hypothetical protein